MKEINVQNAMVDTMSKIVPSAYFEIGHPTINTFMPHTSVLEMLAWDR